MATNAFQQAAFPFLAAASEGERRVPPAALARNTRERRHCPMSADARPFRPVHVTLHWLEHVHVARERLGRSALEEAVRGAAVATRGRTEFHLFHSSVRADGVHLLVEADSADALASGVAAFSAAATRRVNRVTRRLGPVLAERYAVQVLRSPAEFSEALRFLIGREA